MTRRCSSWHKSAHFVGWEQPEQLSEWRCFLFQAVLLWWFGSREPAKCLASTFPGLSRKPEDARHLWTCYSCNPFQQGKCIAYFDRTKYSSTSSVNHHCETSQSLLTYPHINRFSSATKMTNTAVCGINSSYINEIYLEASIKVIRPVTFEQRVSPQYLHGCPRVHFCEEIVFYCDTTEVSSRTMFIQLAKDVVGHTLVISMYRIYTIYSIYIYLHAI